jgi:hypothetical protein
MLVDMAAGNSRGSDMTQRGWNRSNWLAEKIRSGELPAAENEVLRHCDRVFAEDGDLEEHARNIDTVMAAARDAPAERFVRVRAYLERLLLVREMWSRECC